MWRVLQLWVLKLFSNSGYQVHLHMKSSACHQRQLLMLCFTRCWNLLRVGIVDLRKLNVFSQRLHFETRAFAQHDCFGMQSTVHRVRRKSSKRRAFGINKYPSSQFCLHSRIPPHGTALETFHPRMLSSRSLELEMVFIASFDTHFLPFFLSFQKISPHPSVAREFFVAENFSFVKFCDQKWPKVSKRRWEVMLSV